MLHFESANTDYVQRKQADNTREGLEEPWEYSEEGKSKLDRS